MPLRGETAAALVDWALACSHNDAGQWILGAALTAIALWASGRGFASARALLWSRLQQTSGGTQACAPRFVELSRSALLDPALRSADRCALRVDMAFALCRLPEVPAEASELCRSVRDDPASPSSERLRAGAVLANTLALKPDASSLHEVVALRLELLVSASEDAARRVGCEGDLAAALCSLYRHIHSPDRSCDEAIALLARSLTRDSLEMSRERLAQVLAARFERTGELADLDREIELRARLVATCSRNWHDYANEGLVAALYRRFMATRSAIDLDNALDTCRGHFVAAMGEASPPGVHGAHYEALAKCYYARFAFSSRVTDLVTALALLRKARQQARMYRKYYPAVSVELPRPAPATRHQQRTDADRA